MKQNKKKKTIEAVPLRLTLNRVPLLFNTEKSYRKSERDTDLLASHKIGLCSEEQVRH